MEGQNREGIVGMGGEGGRRLEWEIREEERVRNTGNGKSRKQEKTGMGGQGEESVKNGE